MLEKAETDAMKSTIISLLKCADGPDNLETLHALESLCSSLLSNLIDIKETQTTTSRRNHAGFIRTSMAYENTAHNTSTVREVLGNLPSTMIAKLATVLADLMSHRVDLLALLPATQDSAANEEALTTTAITLTPQSFLAAKLYAELIAMPGSWGAGIIQVGALSSLAALLKRWNVECYGNNTGDDDGGEFGDFNKRKPPTQTARAAKRARNAELDSDDDDSDTEDSFGADIDGSPTRSLLTARELKLKGFDLCASVAEIPFLKELSSWSTEATEVVIESTVYAMMTSSAIASAGLTDSKSTKRTVKGDEIVALLSKSLQACAINLSQASLTLDDETGTSTNGQQTIVFILRGLLPLITMQAEVPFGQNGKQAARDIAVTTLERIIEQVSKECETQVVKNFNASGVLSASKTPKSSKRLSKANSATLPISENDGMDLILLNGEATTPRTARKKKRVSFGTIEGKSVSKISPPVLKVGNTPLRSRSRQSNGGTPTQTDERPRTMLTAVVGLLQRLAAFKGLDRAAVRAQAIDAVMRFLRHLPRTECACFLRFLIQLCHSKVAMHRLVGVELVGSCLSKEWFWQDHSETKNSLSARATETPGKTPSRRGALSPMVEALDESMPIALLGCLNGRLSDKAPSVRARAAYAVTEMVRCVEVIPFNENDGDVCVKTKFGIAMKFIGGDILVSLRKRSALDLRATVRKGSITALSELLLFGARHEPSLRVSDTEIKMFCHLCIDESVATRKAAAESLTTLLEMEASNHGHMTTMLEDSWTSSVLPLILDVEPTCVGATLDCFYRVVVDPIINYNGNQDVDDVRIPYETAWRILSHVNENSFREGATKGEYEALREAVRKVTETHGDDDLIAFFNELRDVARRSLQQNVDSEHSEMLRSGCWCILSAFTDQSKDISIFIRWIKRKSVGFEFLTTSWQCMIELYESASTEKSNSSLPSSMRSCLRIIAKMAPHLQVDQSQNISNGLIALVGSFSIGPELLGAAVSALVAITRRANDPEEAVKECSRWVKGLYQRCEEELSSFVTAGGNGNEEKVVRAIFLTGELTMIGFRSDEDPNKKKAIGNSSDSLAGFFERPSQHLLSLGQTLLAKNLPVSDIATPEAARAHAFVALGKLCLRDEAFAKRCLNLLARELHQSISETCASVQSNALLVMGDLCVKYTNLVDRYLPVMAACLQTGVSLDSEISFLADKDGNGAPLVRKHAVLMLSSLLLQDYIKWRGLMFHRFLVAAADDDEGVSKLAEMTLCGPLLGKFPKLFLNNFVESLFVLNRCTAHPIYMAAAASGDSGSGIAVGFEGIILSGAVGRARRLQMYKLMLSKMSDEDKLGVIARLAKDVLGAALDSTGDLGRVCRNPSLSRTPARGSQTFERDESAANVLSDAFAVLTCPSIKVGRAAANLDEDESVEEFNKVRQISAAKGNLMVKISRKQLIEIVLPIVCRLKSILQSSCSPLLKELMRFMSETFRAYKSEVREFLANDPTLLQEVEYDAKQFSKNSMQSGTPVRGLFRMARSPQSVN